MHGKSQGGARVRCVTRVQLQRLALERMRHVLRRDNASER